MKSSKHSKIVLVLITLLCLLLYSSTAFAGQKIRIATFNCEFLIKNKVHKKFGLPFQLKGDIKATWEEPGYRDQKFRTAIKAVATYIKTINADIIVLTEIGDILDFDSLADAISSEGLTYTHKALCNSSDPTGQHVGLLSKIELSVIKYGGKKRIPGREFFIVEPDDAAESDTGISKGLHVSLKLNNKTAHLFAAHLKSESDSRAGGGYAGDAQRIAQASIIRRNYLPFLNQGDYVFVTGDLNDGRGQPTLKRIRGLDDIWPDLIQTGHENYFDDSKLGQRWTYEFKGIRNQIDHILISRNIKTDCKRGKVDASILPQENSLVSDHRPFILDLEFR